MKRPNINERPAKQGSEVVVTANKETGAVFTVSEKSPEFGYFRVESKTKTQVGNLITIQKRYALVVVKVEELEDLYPNLQDGDILPGMIWTLETTEKPYENAQVVVNPETGKEVPHKLTGMPFYRQSFYSEELGKKDEQKLFVIQEETVMNSVM